MAIDNKNNEEEVKVEVEESIKDKQELAEEVMVAEDIIEEENKTEKIVTKKGNNIFLKLFAGFIDQIIVMASALIGLILFDLLLGLFGFYIVEREPIFLIIYVIMNIIYAPILEASKMKKTIGKRVLFK